MGTITIPELGVERREMVHNPEADIMYPGRVTTSRHSYYHFDVNSSGIKKIVLCHATYDDKPAWSYAELCFYDADDIIITKFQTPRSHKLEKLEGHITFKQFPPRPPVNKTLKVTFSASASGQSGLV